MQWNWQTIVIGVAFLCFLLLAKYIVRISLAIVTWGKFIYKLFFLFLSLALEELLCLRSQGKKNKNLFWVPAIAPLISVILSTFFVYITHVDQKGVAIVRISYHSFSQLKYYCHQEKKIKDNNTISSDSCSFVELLKVKHIEKGINPSSVKQIYFTGDNLLKGFRIGAVAGMIALTVSKS